MSSLPESPSSPRRPATAPVTEPRLPGGQCRYILLNPEIRGQRCGCVCFTLNRTLPFVICECGHLPCYHLKEAVQPADAAALGHLSRRIQILEKQLDRESRGGLGCAVGDLVRRQVHLEEQVEMRGEDVAQESRKIYQQISRVWESIKQADSRQESLERRLAEVDRRLARYEGHIQRFEDRLLEYDDAARELEERSVDSLDGHERQTRAQSNPSTTPTSGRRHESGTEIAPGSPQRPPEHWTVHISLLPSASQAFPFEKDTTAYMRCLSRGLHQMVVVQGRDSESFTTAVTATFADVLQGRPWVPLQARLCGAASLQGLPMLRQLEDSLLGNGYDVDFLRRHCALGGPGGRLDSLYIAMARDTLSWHFLRRSRPYLDGLENSWAYDELLDHGEHPQVEEVREGHHPPVSEILPALPSLKRTAPKTSEAEGSKTKVARKSCIPAPLEVRRHVETV